MKIIRIAIFASGAGTNAENIANYFKENKRIKVTLILSNKKDALVFQKAEKLNIKTHYFNKEEFTQKHSILDILKSEKIDFIVLAGFLWLVPKYLIDHFPEKIINIHPALLPKYGGKGMYGDKVHQKVLENNETESGITIHYVNEKYDEGNIILQKKCNITQFDNPQTLADKIHQLEYEHFPKTIEKLITNL
ncbi:MAG: phosphoribosylglycinamide formyltransferase [Bacteroidales bacterium]|nr:phosphoribosylglycinamide formyltransferase [Bacteroidales bacterium]